MIEEFINKIKPKNILDFGCGNGSFDYKKFQSISITAIDKRVPQGVNEFPSNVNFIKMDETSNENTMSSVFENNFDLVIMNFVLEHIKNPILFVSESERVLKNNGYLYIAIPNYKSLQDRLFRLATTIVGSRQGPHIQKFTFKKFLDIIYSKTNLKLENYLVSESGYTFMLNNSFLKLLHRPWMGFMFFFKKMGINLLSNSDYVFILKKW